MIGARGKARSLLGDGFAGAIAGLAASWVMEKAQARISAAGSEETKARERRAEREPATERLAEAAARAIGRSLDDRTRAIGGAIVHYGTGAAFGALFGIVAPRVATPALVAGAAYGLLVWLVNDEVLVPALGFSRGPTAYPASLHAKALASHVVYGAATDASFRVLARVLH
ncbi:MAG TPA: DUF1440 domain-containing protein [Anaeromyxobacter sp.]